MSDGADAAGPGPWRSGPGLRAAGTQRSCPLRSGKGPNNKTQRPCGGPGRASAPRGRNGLAHCDQEKANLKKKDREHRRIAANGSEKLWDAGGGGGRVWGQKKKKFPWNLT